MSRTECPECGREFGTQQGRNFHISKKHDIREIAMRELSKLETPPNYDKCSDEVGFSASLYEDKFDSWNQALEEAGFDIRLRRNIPREELLSEMCRLAEDGRLTYDKMNEDGKFSAKLYEDRFGSWNEALEEAELKKRDKYGKNNPSWSGGKETKCCNYCGDGFDVWPSNAEYRKFCSMECKSKHQSENKTGEDNPSWKEGTTNLPYGPLFKKNRSKVVQRDGGCVVCGIEKSRSGRELHVHHITPRREFYDGNTVSREANEMENLVALCAKHHRKLEGKYESCSLDEFKRKAKQLSG